MLHAKIAGLCSSMEQKSNQCCSNVLRYATNNVSLLGLSQEHGIPGTGAYNKSKIACRCNRNH
jgi:hypothetical protein